jgi:hypothetical protein
MAGKGSGMIVSELRDEFNADTSELRKQIKEAAKIIALNTPMCDSGAPSGYGRVADELDKARDHLRSAMRLLK